MTSKTTRAKRMTKPRIKWLYGICTCNADMTSHGGFKWPTKGRVDCPDWNPEPVCGGGLHFLPLGVGDSSLLDWSAEARWLVIRCDAERAVKIDDQKSRAPWCEVMACGARKDALAWLDANVPSALSVGTHGAMRYAGDAGTAHAGTRGTAHAGNEGTAEIVGRHGLCIGFTVRSGELGLLAVRWWDGTRYRLTVGYVGEYGIKPDTWYSVKDGKLAEVPEPDNWKLHKKRIAAIEAQIAKAREAGR